VKGPSPILICALLLSLFATGLLAQPGSLDITFNPGTGPNDGGDPGVRSMALQPDGKILIAGSFTKVNNMTRMGVARLNADGSLDATFDPGDGIGVGFSILTVVLQTDGKIIIGGAFSSVDGIKRRGIARLRSDGSLDVSYDPSPALDDDLPQIFPSYSRPTASFSSEAGSPRRPETFISPA